MPPRVARSTTGMLHVTHTGPGLLAMGTDGVERYSLCSHVADPEIVKVIDDSADWCSHCVRSYERLTGEHPADDLPEGSDVE